jgi:hypothetical protein
MKLSLGLAAAAALALSSHATAQSLDLCYDVVDIGGGLYEYSFVCEIDAGWAPGMGWRWYIFGDQSGAPSPMTNVAMTSSFPVGPWTQLSSSGGGHNGPTFAPVLDYWIPASGSETLEWSCTSTDLLPQGELLFSTLAGTVGGAVAPNFKVATQGCAGGGCVGDLNGDGFTDLTDLGILLADFGCMTPPGPCVGDLNGDGNTDLTDLGILLADFGCTP